MLNVALAIKNIGQFSIFIGCITIPFELYYYKELSIYRSSLIRGLCSCYHDCKEYHTQIDLPVFSFITDLRMVQPGRLVSSALKYASRRRKVGVHQSGNLGQVASVITAKRVYNLEFTDYSDLKAFFNTIETVFAVTLLTS